MKKTGVFYGSSTGTCEELANQIAEKLRVSSTDVHSVDKMTADKIKEYEERRPFHEVRSPIRLR